MSKDVKDERDIKNAEDEMAVIRAKREERLLKERVPGVCLRPNGTWRAYLHIKDKQVWSKEGFATKSEAVDARLAAEERLHMRKLAVKGSDRKKEAIRSPKQAELFEGVRYLPDGRCEAYRMVKAPAEKDEVRFVEKKLGVFDEPSLAYLCAQAAIAGVVFDETFFDLFLDMHAQAEQIKKGMLEFSQKTLIPLLQLAPSKGKKRKVYRSIKGFRWEQVRRYKTKTIYTSAGPEQVRELSGIYLRLVKEKD